MSVRRRERSHSRSPDRTAHPRCGLRRSSWYTADMAMLNSGGAQAVPDVDPCEVRRVHFHVDDQCQCRS